MSTPEAYQHPIRYAKIRIFKSVEDGEHLGRLKPYDNWPILFFGASEAEVRAKMEEWIWSVIEKHEAIYSARLSALAKGRAARASKLATGDEVAE